MILLVIITAITVLLLGISSLLQSQIQWTIWLSVCVLWAVLSAAILIPGGPLNSQDAVRTDQKMLVQCYTGQRGGQQKHWAIND